MSRNILTFALSMTQNQRRGRGVKVIPLGCLIFASPFASHVSRCLIFVSPLASHVSGCFIFVSPLASHVSGCFIFVSPLASHVSRCLIFVSPLASYVGGLYFRESPCDLDCRFSRSRIPQWFFSLFFSYSVHQITYENTLKSSLLLEMKFDLEIPIFNVNKVSRNFKTIFYVFKTSNFA